MKNFTARDMESWAKDKGSPTRAAKKPPKDAAQVPPPPKVDFDNIATEPEPEPDPQPENDVEADSEL